MRHTPQAGTDEFQWLVYSDFDGALLDHDSYSFEAARPALSLLADKGIPLIPVSSKTCHELLELRSQLHCHSPFATENGAAIYVPEHYFDRVHTGEKELSSSDMAGQNYLIYNLGQKRHYWSEALAHADTKIRNCFISFSELGTEAISLETGLHIEQASAANQREASEPVKWLGTECQLREFDTYIKSLNGQVIRGGRFLHVLDAQVSKGEALSWITRQYRLNSPKTNFRSIALGDAENDLSMLYAADQPAWIRSGLHDIPAGPKKLHGVLVSELYGPAGWNEILLELLGD